jgi:dTDP-4-amino-4,6-dideoxygalactose transaminase
VHTHPDYQSLGFSAGSFPVAEAYYGRCLSLPMFAALSTADQRQVCDALRAALQ